MTVGNAAELGYRSKYLRDKFDCYILDENGEQTLNPDYDDSQEYVSRKGRKEWIEVCSSGFTTLLDTSIKADNWILQEAKDGGVSEYWVS